MAKAGSESMGVNKYHLGGKESMLFWEDELRRYFPDANIDDLSDFDRTAAETFYIALDGGPPFGQEEFDAYNEQHDAYFMEIEISEDETMATLLFLKYPKRGQGQHLYVEETPFLPEHEPFAEKLRRFVQQRTETSESGRSGRRDDPGGQVSVYYKHFTQASDDPLYAPGRVHRVAGIGSRRARPFGNRIPIPIGKSSSVSKNRSCFNYFAYIGGFRAEFGVILIFWSKILNCSKICTVYGCKRVVF